MCQRQQPDQRAEHSWRIPICLHHSEKRRRISAGPITKMCISSMKMDATLNFKTYKWLKFEIHTRIKNVLHLGQAQKCAWVKHTVYLQSNSA